MKYAIAAPRTIPTPSGLVIPARAATLSENIPVETAYGMMKKYDATAPANHASVKRAPIR